MEEENIDLGSQPIHQPPDYEVAVEQDMLMKDDIKAADEVDQMSISAEERSSSNCCTSAIEKIQSGVINFFTKYKSIIKKVVCIVITVLYGIFLVFACYLNLERAKTLLILTGLLIAWLIYKTIHTLLSDKILTFIWMPIKLRLKPKWSIIKWCVIVAVALVVIVLIAVVIGRRIEQYRGLLGLACFVIVLFVTSNNPSKVNWRPVLWGMLLNFIFAMLILKTSAGLAVFGIVSSQVAKFLGYTSAGAAFVFGSKAADHFFAFVILPTIVFFSCVISLLYYLGVMQAIIEKIAFVMQVTMGTSATESLSCAGNIFVGQTEAPILIRPFLQDMTKSELHAVMTGGFATIAGGVLAAFIGMGIDPVHLIAASVMNAPMALAVSKLSYPETEKSKYADGDKITFAKPTEQNFIEAAAAGASQSIGLVANIAANLIAFLSLLAFLNAALSWIGSFVDYPQLSFELICSYLFWIVAFLMGVEAKDCGVVAELIGTKLIINEFAGYEKLSEIIKNKEICASPTISKKSEIIATYALCSFANLSSIGIQLGGIGAMAPSRKADLANIVFRALLAGTVVTLMTGTLAGILIDDFEEGTFDCSGNSTAPNVTNIFNTTTSSNLFSTTISTNLSNTTISP